MKLTLKNSLTAYTVGKIYELTYKGWAWMAIDNNGIENPMDLNNFESIKERFASLNPLKRLTSKPSKGYTTDLLLTENYFVYYVHSKGNHYNVFGNHHKYFHDVNTGEFIPDSQLPASAFAEKTIIKERVIIADWNRLFKPTVSAI
jgi:hypothetical protein